MQFLFFPAQEWKSDHVVDGACTILRDAGNFRIIAARDIAGGERILTSFPIAGLIHADKDSVYYTLAKELDKAIMVDGQRHRTWFRNLWPRKLKQIDIHDLPDNMAALRDRATPKELKQTLKVMWNCFGPASTKQESKLSIFLYSTPSYFNHACLPNCHYTIQPKALEMNVFAITSMTKGEELTIDYTGVHHHHESLLNYNIRASCSAPMRRSLLESPGWKTVLSHWRRKQGICWNCLSAKITSLRCGGCRLVWYCDRGCQREHWPQHKQECKDKQQEELSECVKSAAAVVRIQN